jgi:CRP-like cAMP-binding protein
MQGKFAAALLFHYDKVFMAPSFNILLKRGELAEMIGISRENVIKVIGEFKKDGIIDVDGKNFKILDKERLVFIAENG